MNKGFSLQFILTVLIMTDAKAFCALIGLATSFPRPSTECRDQALGRMTRKEAWYDGTVTGKHNYSSKEIWSGHVPRRWGNPWLDLQSTTEINGSLVRHHRKMDRRWWRAHPHRYD